MRQGACHSPGGDQQLARELELARAELELLRLQRSADGGTPPDHDVTGKRIPPARTHS